MYFIFSLVIMHLYICGRHLCSVITFSAKHFVYSLIFLRTLRCLTNRFAIFHKFQTVDWFETIALMDLYYLFFDGFFFYFFFMQTQREAKRNWNKTQIVYQIVNMSQIQVYNEYSHGQAPTLLLCNIFYLLTRILWCMNYSPPLPQTHTNTNARESSMSMNSFFVTQISPHWRNYTGTHTHTFSDINLLFFYTHPPSAHAHTHTTLNHRPVGVQMKTRATRLTNFLLHWQHTVCKIACAWMQ